jgi:hypothetical protein
MNHKWGQACSEAVAHETHIKNKPWKFLYLLDIFFPHGLEGKTAEKKAAKAGTSKA